MTTREMQEIVSDAGYIIRLFINYSEEMRKIGRGTTVTGRQGHHADTVVAQLQGVISELGFRDLVKEAATLSPEEGE